MLRPLAVLLAIGLTVYAVVDCLGTDERELQGLPRSIWLLVILLLPIFGPIAWVLLGRNHADPGPAPRGGQTVAPDDDPDFLRRLEERKRQQAQEERLRRWEEDLRRRDDNGGGRQEP
ncbi:PLDc N-terminal domain-containing protein [Quadrisphaera sp. GCM10027208]|uniref:PLD nuclease N-terminal domain-containing protein n=1 Tax=Quadrisphaera sp. GCM10027208 TaxID=3273423 RepID=UPI00361A1E2F